jgi:hypothetical protein
MHIDRGCCSHLTYCTNIHPANSWAKVFANLERYVPVLKQRLAPDDSFGLGLRLSGEESRELLQSNHLRRFQDFLCEHQLYVFTLNGFPYGAFHQKLVKEAVHQPDWRDEERIAYTLRLIEILATLLPSGCEGSISTSPLSYKAWVNPYDPVLWEQFTSSIVRIAQALILLKQERGVIIHLDIEPEPGGLLEKSEEVVRFYRDWLLEKGAHMLSEQFVLTREEARSCLLEHIRICFDTCHVAVAYEEPATVLDRFAQAGIKVGKIQLSSALKVIFPPVGMPRSALACALEPFAESTYLHQVVQRNHDGTFLYYSDLPLALPYIQNAQIAEWRIHFHVPIFIDRFPAFQSTQDTIIETLHLLRQRDFCHHLEIETYTWGVLPADLQYDLSHSIIREYRWVLSGL